MDDSNALAHFSLGVVHDRQGADASAIAQYRAAIERDPNNVQALVYLADATLRTGSALEAAKTRLEVRMKKSIATICLMTPWANLMRHS